MSNSVCVCVCLIWRARTGGEDWLGWLKQWIADRLHISLVDYNEDGAVFSRVEGDAHTHTPHHMKHLTIIITTEVNIFNSHNSWFSRPQRWFSAYLFTLTHCKAGLKELNAAFYSGHKVYGRNHLRLQEMTRSHSDIIVMQDAARWEC